jgi:hypothetical protein
LYVCPFTSFFPLCPLTLLPPARSTVGRFSLSCENRPNSASYIRLWEPDQSSNIFFGLVNINQFFRIFFF